MTDFDAILAVIVFWAYVAGVCLIGFLAFLDVVGP